VQKNQLYYGDSLTVLREHIKDESVDLIYLDPPFNSRQDYNVLFAERDGTRSASQIRDVRRHIRGEYGHRRARTL
jgi:site-specific DNA-methyltransferase (adenine-specific)